MNTIIYQQGRLTERLTEKQEKHHMFLCYVYTYIYIYIYINIYIYI